MTHWQWEEKIESLVQSFMGSFWMTFVVSLFSFIYLMTTGKPIWTGPDAVATEKLVYISALCGCVFFPLHFLFGEIEKRIIDP